MITREEYILQPSGQASHRAYYAQFVTPEVLEFVSNHFGLERLLGVECLGDIGLGQWDRAGLPYTSSQLLKDAGDSYSLSAQVCILKEAARQLRENI